MDYSTLPDENQYIEYKKNSTSLSKDVWESIAAFSNTEGGIIVLGIEEKKVNDKSQFIVSGVTNMHKILDEFWSNIDEILNVNTLQNKNVQVVKVGKKNVIEITVPEAKINQKPVRANGTPYIRKGAVDVKAKGEDLKMLLINTATNLDTNVLHNYWIEDLDKECIEEYRRELTAREQYRSYKNLSVEEFLKKIGVIAKDYDGNGEYGITIGGLLFFGDNNAIIHKFPYFQLDYFDQSKPNVERWLNRISSVTDNLNIYSFYRRAMHTIRMTVDNHFELDSKMNRKDTAGAMIVALREALLNMLMYANYYGKEPIRAIAKVNYYEFTNPGKMLVPVETFFTTNHTSSRNPIISKLFVQLGESERAGHGGEKIYESALVNNYRKPKITSNYEGTKLRIWKVDYADSFSGQIISDRERLILKAIVTSEGQEMSHKQIEEETGLSRTKVDSSLKELISKGTVIKIGKGRATKYGIHQTKEQLLALAQAMPNIIRRKLSKYVE
ncbi:RNA-binding domain-containing protein [Limosilactobacillus reuteri]|uniref:RNA-binding domain-containing protein n=1 Tax=Limosilactobacillus reuteri TaxID=1598 RepID=UPI003D068E71